MSKGCARKRRQVGVICSCICTFRAVLLVYLSKDIHLTQIHLFITLSPNFHTGKSLGRGTKRGFRSVLEALYASNNVLPEQILSSCKGDEKAQTGFDITRS